MSGWVKNLPDGRVEAVVEGEPDRVARMMAWLKEGPPMSRVAEIHVTEETPTGEFSGFEVVFSRSYW